MSIEKKTIATSTEYPHLETQWLFKTVCPLAKYTDDRLELTLHENKV